MSVSTTQRPARPAGDLTGQLTAALRAAAATLPPAQQRRLVARRKDLPQLIADLAARLERGEPKTRRTAKAEVVEGEGLGALLPLDEGRRRLHAYAMPMALEEWAGPVAGASELERDYGVARSTLHAWQQRGAVIGLQKGVRKHVFPLAQFIDARPVEGLAQILQAVGAPRTAWLWLVTKHPELRNAAPIEKLRAGRIDEVIDLAERDYAQS